MEAYVRSLGVGHRPLDDPFFEEGNQLCEGEVYKREGVVDIDEEQLCHQLLKTFTCDVLNCKMEFDNLLNYELHYNSKHRYSCSECKKQLPSPHLLDLHVSETHDSFFKALAERKPMYQCFVEDCPERSKTPQERRSHCIEVHRYPHDFRYDHSNRKSHPKKCERRNVKKEKSPAADDGKMDCDEKEAKPHLPAAFSFGHKKSGKTFKTSKAKKEKPIEMHELMESLPN